MRQSLSFERRSIAARKSCAPILMLICERCFIQRKCAGDDAKRSVTETVIAQPAIFTIEYALAQLWLSWGIRPKAMAGHSIGEFVAACLAGVISLDDALAVVALRGKMMQRLPAGGMLSVRLPEADLRKRLREPLSLAAINSPSLCVVAGALEPLGEFERELTEAGIACRRLVTSHAFHSAMMDPLIEPLAGALSKTRLNPPQIPYVSGVTGAWITAAEATDPRYWARHAREPVQFSKAVRELRKNPEADSSRDRARKCARNARTSAQRISREPGHCLIAFRWVFRRRRSEALFRAVGALWLAGTQPDWSALYRANNEAGLVAYIPVRAQAVLAGEHPRMLNEPSQPIGVR